MVSKLASIRERGNAANRQNQITVNLNENVCYFWVYRLQSVPLSVLNEFHIKTFINSLTLTPSLYLKHTVYNCSVCKCSAFRAKRPDSACGSRDKTDLGSLFEPNVFELTKTRLNAGMQLQ